MNAHRLIQNNSAMPLQSTDRKLYCKWIKCYVSVLILQICLFVLTSGALTFADDSDQALYIDAEGYVGIGTDNPQSQLDVAGDAKIGGQLDVAGDARVKGNISFRARYQRDDEPESSYEISPRYHLSLTGAKYGGKTKTIPQDVLEALCADPDGCEIRLAMTRWTNDTQTESASVFFTFYYSAQDGHWRASQTDASSTSGVDGDNVIKHVRNIWNVCFFTDGTYSGYKQIGDKERGMQLLVWKDDKKNYKNVNRTCEITIID